MAILSRSFYDSWLEHDIDEIERVFKYGMEEIREYERRLMDKPPEFFARQHETVKDEVAQVVESITRRNAACATAK